MARPSPRRIAATALTMAATAASPATAEATPARAADGFVDSIGVNVHLSYNQTPYARHDIVQRKLQRLGVRYVRDHLFPNRPDMYKAFKSLASCGIKANLIVGDPLRRWTIGSIPSQLRIISKENLGEAIESLEGPNEYDLQGDRNWVPVLRDYQRRLYSAVKASPELRRFPVIGPSVVRVVNYWRLGDVSESLDYGNIHPYPGGERPDAENSNLQQLLGFATKNSGSKPVQATEAGYHNGLRSSNAHYPATERAAGLYMPRLFLENYRQGTVRTYSYELLDQRPDRDGNDSEANFGLLRNDYSEKPAYTAVRRTIELLSDPGPRFRPGALSYQVAGADSGVKRVLLQKRDGAFYLAIWRDESVWNPQSRQSVRAASGAVKLLLGKRAGKVEVFRPSEASGPVHTAKNARSVNLDASASVAIVKISQGPTKASSAPYKGLTGKERRVARKLLRLRAARNARTASADRRVQHLSRWLVKRSRTIRSDARQAGWKPQKRRVRYRAIRRVLRSS